MKLYLLDGSGFLYRAYHALPELNNKDGNNINAILGFVKMIFKLLQDKPDYFCIVWDSPAKTIRHEMFTEYKAHRPPMPDNFKRQINQIKELIKECGFAFEEAPGYEADDILFTFGEKFGKEKTIDTFVVSSDKDLKQLLAPTVHILDAMKGERIELADFEKERGFAPQHFVDYQALLGDSSDNIPGVAGIGKKTGQDLIMKYHTIENLYNHLDECSAGVKEKLTANKDNAFLSKRLAQMQIVPGLENVSLNSFKVNLDFKALTERLINQNNFHSLAKSIENLKIAYKKPSQTSLFG